MIITQVHLVLGTIKDHSKMCSLVTAQCHRCLQFWGSVQLACWLQECPPELLLNNSIFISLPWAASNVILENLAVCFNRLTTADHVQPRQPRTSTSGFFTCRIVGDQPPGQLMKLWVCTTEEFLHKLSETVSAHLHAHSPHQGLYLTEVRHCT
jgi:hypothetical protein